MGLGGKKDGLTQQSERKKLKSGAKVVHANENRTKAHKKKPKAKH